MRNPIKMLMILTVFALNFGSSAEAGDLQYTHTIVTEQSDIRISSDEVTLPGGAMHNIPGAPAIQHKNVKLSLPPGTRIDGFAVETSNPKVIWLGEVGFIHGDLKTGDFRQDTVSTPDQRIYNSNNIYPQARVEILNSGYWGDIHVADLAVYPAAYRPLSGQLILYREITIRFNLVPSSFDNGLIVSADPFAYRALGQAVDNKADLPAFASPGGGAGHEGILGGIPSPEYLVITSGDVAPGFFPFVEWKNQKGLPTDMAMIEDILASSSGIDPAEQLRNYLIGAYNSGVRYVLLGGDEDVVPIRYLYPNNINGSVPELRNQQISDLYFADLTGNWDVDGDGVWGESYNDEPDYYPELYVGRVPAGTAQQAAVWGDKAILYEKNPGNGDPSYLTKALFICADQMRDLNQHNNLANMFPFSFTIDASRLVEEPSGNSQSPTQPLASTVIDVLQEGWGFTTNLNHGDFSWYSSQSNGYNSSQLSGVWGDTVVWEGCGAMSNLTTFEKPAVHYTISCILAAFDFDKEIFFPGPYIRPHCFMESYLFEPGAGVAFLGNTRWGWVSASYNLERRFIFHVLEDSTSKLSVAEALSKLDYPNYRDICYGHNLFGDPEMSLWTSVEGALRIVGSVEYGGRSLREPAYTVYCNKQPVSQARVCRYKAGELFEIGYTDDNGQVLFVDPPDYQGFMTATATKQNYIPDQLLIKIGTPMGINDEEGILPETVELGQNYPNPFNPSTTIEFSLPEMSEVGITIYDIAGRAIKWLVGASYPAGTHKVTWNGENYTGEPVASGVYFYKISAGTTTLVRQMIMLK